MNEILRKLLRQALYVGCGAQLANADQILTDPQLDSVIAALALVANFVWSWVEFRAKARTQTQTKPQEIMQTKSLLPLLLCSALMLGTGCTTTKPGDSNSIVAAGRISRTAAKAGTIFAVRKNAENRKTLEGIKAEMDAMLATTNWTAPDFMALVSKFPGIAEGVQGDGGTIYIKDGLLLVADLFLGNMQVGSQPALRAVMSGFSAGIGDGLLATMPAQWPVVVPQRQEAVKPPPAFIPPPGKPRWI